MVSGRVHDDGVVYRGKRYGSLSEIGADAGLNDDALINILKEANADLRDYARLLAIIARTPLPEYKSARASAQAFIVAEQIRTGLSQLALARAAARSAPDDPETAALVNRVQQLRDRWRAMTKKLTKEYESGGAQRDPDLLPRLQQQEARLGRQFQEANEELRRRFPAYADLIAPDPIDPSTAAQLLAPDEALIAYMSLNEQVKNIPRPVRVFRVRRAGWRVYYSGSFFFMQMPRVLRLYQYTRGFFQRESFLLRVLSMVSL